MAALIVALSVLASACATDSNASGWDGITDVPDPTEVFDPTLGNAGPPGYRTLLARDQIEPVYRPRFVASNEVTWSSDALVIGVDIEGEARAYPIGFLTTREMVIDNHRGIPTLVTW